jgi:hypothetical protein
VNPQSEEPIAVVPHDGICGSPGGVTSRGDLTKQQRRIRCWHGISSSPRARAQDVPTRGMPACASFDLGLRCIRAGLVISYRWLAGDCDRRALGRPLGANLGWARSRRYGVVPESIHGSSPASPVPATLEEALRHCLGRGAPMGRATWQATCPSGCSTGTTGLGTAARKASAAPTARI